MGADALMCSCGTFAIGRCCNCKRPVCGEHSRLEQEGRVCLDCLPILQQRREQQRVATEDREKARQSALPSMGAEQFAAFCRGVRDERGALFAGLRDSDSFLLRPMQGKVLAQALAIRGARTCVDEVQKSLGRKQVTDLGWQIWQTVRHSIYEKEPPFQGPRYYLERDGTVYERKSLGRQIYASGYKHTGTATVKAISATTYWSVTVLHAIAHYIRCYPEEPVIVYGDSNQPLYSDQLDTWPEYLPQDNLHR
jgi:hypothetical protein